MAEDIAEHVDDLRRLAGEADERTIKRAYAKALKVIRPDEDPAGFQQLHEAYQRALAQCARRQEQRGGADGVTPFAPVTDVAEASDAGMVVAAAPPQAAVAPHLQPVDLALPPQPDPRDAVSAMLREGAHAVPAWFPAWLLTHSSDWSFDTRDAVAMHLLQVLRGGDVLMCESNVLAMYNLLGWNDIASGLDAGELRWLAERTHRAWLQLPEQHDGLAIMMAGFSPDRPSSREVAARLADLQVPRPHLRNLWNALRPQRVRAVAALMSALGCQPGVPLPRGIDSGQATFWAGQAQDWSRLQLHGWLFRASVLSLLLVGIAFWVMWLDDYAFLREQSPLLSALLAVGLVLLPPVLVLGSFGRHALYAWQLAPESMRSPRPRLRAAGVPLLVGALLLVAATYPLFIEWAPLYMLGMWLLTWQVLRIAQVRYYVRRTLRPPESSGALFLMVLGTAMFAPAVVAALVYWALDLRRARAMRWWHT